MATVQLTPEIDVRRAESRFVSDFGWLDSKHSFSFGHHHDPRNTHHGLLLVNNDDIVDAGTGFDTHPHRDMEIVTWVLDGSLVHQDSTGHNGVIYPGLAQRMSAGTGILHSEKNDSWRLAGPEHRDPVHFVQMWVLPDTESVQPGYEQLDVNDQLDRGGLVITAFPVDHRPVEPAFGYRFDWRGRSVVVSGDTKKSASLVRNAKDADILVHEALVPVARRQVHAHLRKLRDAGAVTGRSARTVWRAS